MTAAGVPAASSSNARLACSCRPLRILSKRRQCQEGGGSAAYHCLVRRALRECQSNFVEPSGLEAPGGFEPPDNGFAVRCLTTWLRRRLQLNGAAVSHTYLRVATPEDVGEAASTASCVKSRRPTLDRYRRSSDESAGPSDPRW